MASINANAHAHAQHAVLAKTLHYMLQLTADNFGVDSRPHREVNYLGDLFCNYYDSKKPADLETLCNAVSVFKPEKTEKGCLKLCLFELSQALFEIRRN